MDQICPKSVFSVGNGKIAVVRASMVVKYYIKLLSTGADRHNGILMSLLYLVAETNKDVFYKSKHRAFYECRETSTVEYISLQTAFISI